MTQARKKKLTARIITAIVLYVLAAILILVSVFGFFLRGSDSIQNNLNTMRTHAVLHAASGGLVDSIASQARSDKLKELRARKDFRTLGLDEVNSTCDAAAAAARAEAEALYSNATVQNAAGLENAINAMEKAMSVYGGLREKERAVYSDLYVSLVRMCQTGLICSLPPRKMMQNSFLPSRPGLRICLSLPMPICRMDS